MQAQFGNHFASNPDTGLILDPIVSPNTNHPNGRIQSFLCLTLTASITNVMTSDMAMNPTIIGAANEARMAAIDSQDYRPARL